MKTFLLAIQFLTIIPIRINKVSHKNIVNSVILFPVIGLLIGLLLAIIAEALSSLGFAGLYVNTIIIVILAALTGGIHLDGLADTADAFLSGKTREEKLKIMRDPHIGTMGALSIVCIILLKIALLSSIAANIKTPALILSCVISRWVMVMLMFRFPYARKDGKAAVFMSNINFRMFLITTLIALSIASSVWQFKAILVFAISGLVAYIFGRFANRKLGGITGDLIGAINEISEVIILLAVFFIWRI